MIFLSHKFYYLKIAIITLTCGCLLFISTVSNSSTITNARLAGHGVIALSGDFTLGDDDRFKETLFKPHNATGVLESVGSSLPVAIHSGARCFGSCILAWLGRVERNVSLDGQVGIHAFSRQSLTRDSPATDTPRLVASYFNQLNLSDAAIFELGADLSTDSTPLTTELTKGLGISIHTVDGAAIALEELAQTAAPQTPPNAPPADTSSAKPVAASPEQTALVYLAIQTTPNIRDAKQDATKYRRIYPDAAVHALADGSYVVTLSKVFVTDANALLDRAVKAGRLPANTKIIPIESVGPEIFRP